MWRPTVLFSSHFSGAQQTEEWSPRVVGFKAAGLASLPEEWTPAFAVISAAQLPEDFEAEEATPRVFTTEYVRHALAPILTRKSRRLIVRSSASAEHLECRGWLESKTCDGLAEDVARVTCEIFCHAVRVLKNSSDISSELALVIQEFKTPRLYGHLSNERRVTHSSNRWLCEIETPTVAGAPKLSWLKVPRGSFSPVPKELLCPTEADLEQALSALARWSADQKLRSHFEWVWDGAKLWVVQRDIENEERGNKPNSSATSILFEVSEPKLSVFVHAAKTKKRWEKVESLKTFASAGLPKANLFALEDDRVLGALAKGKTPPHIKRDLVSLVQSPIVVRTDFITTGGKSAFLSPRSETLATADAALQWLKQNATDIVARGARPGQFCFLAHRYITAAAGAIALSRPGNPRVRVDSIWGLPDGLLCFPHDSFEVDTGRKGQIVRHVRCKPFCLTSNEAGAWARQKCFVPWDWKPSLTDEELEQIARHTKKTAEFLKRGVEIMFFVGVDTKTGYPPILPWIRMLDLPDKPKEPGDYYYAGKPFTISNEVDLVRLRDSLTREREIFKVYIRLQPSPDLLRSPSFVKQVATTANELKIPVQLEGSILSHIYYMLTKQGVRVRCANAFLPVKTQRFGKLVRDLVPVTIEGRGERVRTVTVPKEDLAKLLKVKALEEAFELFWEPDSAKSFAEMADILEVVLSACRAYGRDFDDLVALARKKRAERGGFDKGVVLVETTHVPLIGDDEPALALFEGGTSATSSALPMVAYKASRRPRARGKEAAIPLIPPNDEDLGKQYVVSLPDDEHELVVRYTPKELIATVRRKPPPPPSPNQLELKFG